jgi:hypothetical protein
MEEPDLADYTVIGREPKNESLLVDALCFLPNSISHLASEAKSLGKVAEGEGWRD